MFCASNSVAAVRDGDEWSQVVVPLRVHPLLWLNLLVLICSGRSTSDKEEEFGEQLLLKRTRKKFDDLTRVTIHGLLPEDVSFQVTHSATAVRVSSACSCCVSQHYLFLTPPLPKVRWRAHVLLCSHRVFCSALLQAGQERADPGPAPQRLGLHQRYAQLLSC